MKREYQNQNTGEGFAPSPFISLYRKLKEYQNQSDPECYIEYVLSKKNNPISLVFKRSRIILLLIMIGLPLLVIRFPVTDLVRFFRQEKK
jgi:hypothetical protein